MEKINLSLNKIKTNYEEYINNLNRISASIKDVEAKLQSQDIRLEYSKNIRETQGDNGEKLIQTICWQSFSGKWRLCYQSMSVDNFGIPKFEIRPLIECSIDSRIFCYCFLSDFLSDFNNFIDAKVFETSESIMWSTEFLN